MHPLSGDRASRAGARDVPPSRRVVASSPTFHHRPAKISAASRGRPHGQHHSAYVEQVTITQSLAIVGAGVDESIIEAPASLVGNSQPQPQNAIIDISGGATTVSMSKLTVAGPGPQGGGLDCSPNASSLDKGIDVHGSATLNLTTAAVRNVYNRPNGGCQRGDGISIGSACYSGCTADVGHATLTSVKISIYQKNGIAVRGSGSSLKMTGGTVADNPNSENATNGIEVVKGAVGVVARTTITGNQCTNPSACTSDPFSLSKSMADGVLVLGAGAGTQFTGLKVHGNDMGMYTDDGVRFTGDNASNNLYDGIFVDVDATHAVVKHDTASNDGTFGIIAVSGSLNAFASDTATGNTTFDLDFTGVQSSDTNTYSSNHSTNASPSMAYWHST